MTTSWTQLIAAQSLGYLAGYQLARGEMEHWRPFAQAYDARLQQLTFNRVFRPFGLFLAVPDTAAFYNEAVYAYLFGLPNASVPMSTRCLELGLAHCHKSAQPKATPPNLDGLITWAQNALGSHHQLAHSVRLLRNLIHQTTPITEPSALEAIRHTSLLTDHLMPFQIAPIQLPCQLCGATYTYSIPRADFFLGNLVPVRCLCGQDSTAHII